MTDSLPSWTWPGCEGRIATVEVFGNGAELELLQDGVSLGRKQPEHLKAVFELPYRPGTLTAVSYNADGSELNRAELSTVGKSEKLQLLPEEKEIGKNDIVFVPIHITDADGRQNMSDFRRIELKIEGCGELLALGSACPDTEENYHGTGFSAYRGRTLAVIKSGDKSGTIRISAHAEGLCPDETVVKVR